MPDEDKTFSGSLVLDLRIWWRHAHTLYAHNAVCCMSWKVEFSFGGGGLGPLFLNFLDPPVVFCLQISFSDLKMIGVFTSSPNFINLIWAERTGE